MGEVLKNHITFAKIIQFLNLLILNSRSKPRSHANFVYEIYVCLVLKSHVYVCLYCYWNQKLNNRKIGISNIDSDSAKSFHLRSRYFIPIDRNVSLQYIYLDSVHGYLTD